MRVLAAILTYAMLAPAVLAEVHHFNWTAGWMYGNPDGNARRQIIGCNGEWPWPTIRIKEGDTIELYLTNGMDNQTTSLHFHGLFQQNTTIYDGVPGATQCSIAPGQTMLYNITVDGQFGTTWYHSHSDAQFMDGLRGVLIIDPKDGKYPYDYDEEVVLTLSDWYHLGVDYIRPDFMNRFNPTGAEPIPQNLLWNETRNGTWNVKPNTTYLMRIISMSGFVGIYVYLEGHDFEIVAVDGVPTENLRS
ncbi:unnamed protein product [Ambrosiozyma monospora]|uniref:Unnamed protein product n=1 Tax=Ambrosiozyma monospora TaxID=43982 RepID=A0A9W6Z1N5_AMBMO|nr:unnamed protein product [Ambrosiozyma monospora]